MEEIHTTLEKEATYVCTTADIWISRRRRFISVTAHWVRHYFSYFWEYRLFSLHWTLRTSPHGGPRSLALYPSTHFDSRVQPPSWRILDTMLFNILISIQWHEIMFVKVSSFKHVLSMLIAFKFNYFNCNFQTTRKTPKGYHGITWILYQNYLSLPI